MFYPKQARWGHLRSRNVLLRFWRGKFEERYANANNILAFLFFQFTSQRTELHIPTILLLGLQALLFKKRFPVETETWPISSRYLSLSKTRIYCIEITGNNVENVLTRYRPNVKLATLVSYSFVYIQVSLTSLVLKCKIPKNTLSQGRQVRLIVMYIKEY